MSIETITFHVLCVSPTLSFGAKHKHEQPEEEIFRATSLRGCWRFWARAAIVGAMEMPHSDILRRLESCLFGDTKPALQAFRLRVIPLTTSFCKEKFLILPHKHQGQKTGSPPRSLAEVRISLNQTVYNTDQARKALLAIVWLWANLGGIGTRSRRGFGSVALLQDKDCKDCFAAAGLPPSCACFPDRTALVEHLKNGITQSLHLIREWMAARGCTPQALQSSRNANKEQDMFILNSMAQVFVGETAHQELGAKPMKTDGLLKVISDKKVIPDETGSASPRLASPMIVRVHQCADGFIPVLTWSPRSNTTIAKAVGNTASNYQWLNDLGFDQSLLGDSLYA